MSNVKTVKEVKLTTISTNHQIGFVKVDRPVVDGTILASRDAMRFNEEREVGPLYAVSIWGDLNATKMYTSRVVFKGHGRRNGDTSQWLVWFAGSGKMFTGFGTTRVEAVERAIKDAWLYV